MINCLLCGVGGQGIVLASKLISGAAMNKGEKVIAAETIGMAQRGGSVVSHVRIGNEAFSPLIPLGKADVIISFEPSEAVRNIAYLKKDGIVITAKKAIQPVTASLSEFKYSAEDMINFLNKASKNLITVDGEKICNECKSSKVLNVALIGAAITNNIFDITVSDIEKIISEKFKPQIAEMNIKALNMGAKVGGTEV